MHREVPNINPPWLDNMNNFAKEKIKTGSIILACSALKEIYRRHLIKDIEANFHWVFLKGSYDTILQRMKKRQEHYMPSALLQSQFDALEEPADAIIEDTSQAPEIIVEHIIEAIE